jgi:hypothetical protein
MESVVRNLGGIPISPKTLYKELETGCLRAVPDNELAAQLMQSFFEMPTEERLALGKRTRELFLEHYRWEKSGKAWEDYFDSVEIVPDNLSWSSEPRIRHPAPKPESIPNNVNHNTLAKWLISNVLCEPEKLNSYLEARLTRDLMYKSHTSLTGGMYFNESSAAFDGKLNRNHFDFNVAYDHMSSLCHRRNYWEQKRVEARNK